MKAFIEKLKELFLNNRPKFIAGIVAIAALSLPFVINQVLKQQDIRQRADTAPSITFSFSPGSQNMTVNQTINVDLIMNAGTNDVGALHFSLKYDPTMLDVNDLAQSTALQSITKTNNKQQGVFDVVMINPTVTPVTGNSLKVFTFQFKALKSGTTNVALDPTTLQATSQLSTTYLLVDNKDNIKASFTLGGSQGSSDNNNTSFDYNNGKNHCRPTGEACETALGETATQTDCSAYLGASARVCTAANGYQRTSGTNIGCPTVQTDGSINYCLPTTQTVPSGWSEIAAGNADCTTYNGVASKCYKSTYNMNGNSNSPIVTTTTTITTTVTTTVTSTVTPTQIPTVTLAPGETGLKLSLTLPGISKRNGENDHPLRTRRTVKVTVYDSTSQESVVVAEKTGTVDFNPTTAKYEGSVGIGTTIATGNYVVKVRMDNTLRKRLPGTVHVTQGNADNPTPTVELVTGDLNQDNALGVQDYTNIMACYNHLPACTGDILVLGDLDDDGVTTGDNDDINIMQFNTINRTGD